MYGLKSVVGALALTAMVTTSALAGGNTGPLAPGKPAGVHQAQSQTGVLLLGAAAAAIALSVALVVSSQNANNGFQTAGAPFSTAATSTVAP